MSRSTIDTSTVTQVIVDRLVPGKIIYVVDDNEPQSSAAFKLNEVVIQTRNGEQPYRGESFSELGVHVGKKLYVKKVSGDRQVLIIDPNKHDSILSRVSYFLKT